MSILDDIANPKVPSYLEGLRVVEDIETSRINRRLAEIQAGAALNKMQQEREAQARRQRGTEYIQSRLERPKETQPQAISREGIGPPQQPGASGQPKLKPAPAETAEINPLDNMHKISTDQLKDANTYLDIADYLAKNDDPRAKEYYDMGTKVMQQIRTESEEERKTALKSFEEVGNSFYKISKLEDQKQPEEAAALFDKTKQFLAQDPRFANDPYIQKFLNSFPEYVPGVGKYIYATTMSFNKAREQFQKEREPDLKAAQDMDDIAEGLYGKPYLKLNLPQRQAVLEYKQKQKEKVSAVAGTGLKEEQHRIEVADNLIKATQKAFDMATDWNTGLGSVFAYLPEFGTNARNLKSIIDTIKANIGFEELNQMRKESKTGGALGQVTERELELLQSTIQSLDQAQSKEQLQNNLLKIQSRYRVAKNAYQLMHAVNNAAVGETIMLPDGREIIITDKSDPNGNYTFDWVKK